MENVLSRLKNHVSGTLPGNPVTREFDLDIQIASCGPNLSWKLYAATKRSSKESATVWIFEKKCLDRYSKNERVLVMDKLRQGVSALTRLRHPRVLSVVHPLEESRESLGFATEPLFTSLANAIGRHDNLTGPGLERLKTFKFTETEIKYGIIQIFEGLIFLHRNGHQLHINVAPESIVVNRLGSWKLCGFEFVCLGLGDSQAAEEGINVSVWQSNLPQICRPNLDFCAPEVIIEGRGYAASDFFSVGMLLYILYNDGVPLVDCRGICGAYREAANKLKSLAPNRLSNIPDGIREYTKMLLHYDHSIRPDAHEILKLTFFDDANVNSLKSLDDLYQLDNLARSNFYKNLPNSIKMLPPRINLHRVFPQLAEEFPNKNMIPFVLPSILQIIEMSNPEEVSTFIMPRFKSVLTEKEPLQIILILLQNLRILAKKLSPTDFKTYALPTLDSALETNTNAILELCLRSLPEVAKLMDFSVLKSNIVPRLKKVYTRIDLVSVHLDVLICIGKMLEYLDKWCVMDDVLPFLVQIRSREPKILVAILSIYRVAFSHKKLGISRDTLASKSIPHLLQISMDCNLSLQQYAAFADLMREMFLSIEAEQRAKLSELHSLREDAATIVAPSTNIGVTASEMVDSLMSILAGVAVASVGVLHPTTDGDNRALNQPHNGATGVGAPTPLTLEQKRQAAGHLSRFEDGNLLVPNQPPATRQPAQAPRDLTSQLSSSNMGFSWNATRPSNPPTTTAAFNSLGGGFSHQPNYQGFGSTPTNGMMATTKPLQEGFHGSGPMSFAPTSTMCGRPSTAPSAGTAGHTTPGTYQSLSKLDIDDLLG